MASQSSVGPSTADGASGASGAVGAVHSVLTSNVKGPLSELFVDDNTIVNVDTNAHDDITIAVNEQLLDPPVPVSSPQCRT